MNMIFVTPARYNYSIVAGNTFHDSFILKKSDGTPFDLTGWKSRLRAKRYPDDEVYLIDLSTDNGAIKLGNETGTVDVLAEVATVRSWGRAIVTFQHEFEDAAGRVQTYVYGEFEIKTEQA